MNYFEVQLEKAKPITDVSLFKSASIYSEYQVGDTILYFFDATDFSDKLIMKSFTLRELDTFLFEHTYMTGEQFPVFFKNL